jgi:hypothetical protein
MNIPKYYLLVVHKATFQVVDRLCEHIFYPLGIQKCDFDEVEEAMIQVVEWPSEHNICIIVIAKCVFGEVDKAIFQVV